MPQTIASLPEGRWVEVNDAYLRIMEYTREEMVGHTSAELKMIDSNDRTRIIKEFTEKGDIHNRELVVHTKTGKEIVVLSSYEKISLNGRDHFITTLIDITNRKKAEEALRETRDYLDNLFNYANAPIIVWNPDFEITRFNYAFERLTGRTAKEVLGKKLEILFPDDSRENSMNLIHKTVFGERWETVEIPILNKDGTVHTVLWNSATLYDQDANATATIAQGQDITDRKKAEEELKQRTAELEVSNKELESFSYSVSHDLRAPLRSMQGFSSALLEDYADKLDDQGKLYLKYVQESSDLMSQLIDDLLKLSRVTRSEMNYDSVNLSEIVQKITDELQKVQPLKNLKVNNRTKHFRFRRPQPDSPCSGKFIGQRLEIQRQDGFTSH